MTTETPSEPLDFPGQIELFGPEPVPLATGPTGPPQRRTDLSRLRVVDLYAGAGGWDVAAGMLGLDPVGIEWNDAACQTRRAAGLLTLQADLLTLDPHAYAAARGGRLDALIASPPCQTFSQAGHGTGRAALDAVLAAVAAMRDGRDPWEGFTGDERTQHVLVPLFWTLALRPRWIAWEQVPPVLPVWQACAAVLRDYGYSVAVGYLNAEEYGTPQTRKRAYLVARSDGPVSLPRPTHVRYRIGKPRTAPGLLPWVSMADALGLFYVDPAGPLERDREAFTELGQERTYVADVADVKPWTFTRPATTIAGRGLVPDPGANANRFNGATKSRNDGVRITVAQAGVLQGFPENYPWQGSQTAAYLQAGNAVAVPVAHAVLASLVDPS